MSSHSSSGRLPAVNHSPEFGESGKAGVEAEVAKHDFKNQKTSVYMSTMFTLLSDTLIGAVILFFTFSNPNPSTDNDIYLAGLQLPPLVRYCVTLVFFSL